MKKTNFLNSLEEGSPQAGNKVNHRHTTKAQPLDKCDEDSIKNPEVRSNRTVTKNDFVDDDDGADWSDE